MRRWVGTRARSRPRGCAPRSMPRSRTRTGRWLATRSAMSWPHRLWDIKKPYQWNGGSGGAGIGYNLPASIGAALANKRHGRLTVAFGGDGDFNVRAERAVDRGAPQDPATLRGAQQPRLSPGGHVSAGDGGAPRAWHRQRGYRDDTQAIRTSTMPPWRGASASTERVRLPTRRTSRQRSSARSQWSSAANPR